MRLIQGRKFIVLDRNTLDTLITELEFQESELVAPESRKQLGRFMGAEAVLSTTVFDTGSYVKVGVTLYDVSSAVSLGAADCRIDRKTIPPFLLLQSVFTNQSEPVLPVRPTLQEEAGSSQNAEPVIEHSPGEIHHVYEPSFTVSLKVSPPEAIVKLDHTVVEPVIPGLYKIVKSSGKYSLEVEARGYRPSVSTITLVDNDCYTGIFNNERTVIEKDISIELDRIKGVLELAVYDPDGRVFDGDCQIFLDGEILSKSGIGHIDLQPGIHTLTIATESYYQIEREFTIVDGERKNLDINLIELPVEPEPGSTSINSLGMTLTWIPRGGFLMGSPETEQGRMPDEGPVHHVEITRGFWMGSCEVTRGQYQMVMDTDKVPLHLRLRPVGNISWEEATAFCERLSALENKTYRLPTEAEWEYAWQGRKKRGVSFQSERQSMAQIQFQWFNKKCRTKAPEPMGAL